MFLFLFIAKASKFLTVVQLMDLIIKQSRVENSDIALLMKSKFSKSDVMLTVLHLIMTGYMRQKFKATSYSKQVCMGVLYMCITYFPLYCVNVPQAYISTTDEDFQLLVQKKGDLSHYTLSFVVPCDAEILNGKTSVGVVPVAGAKRVHNKYQYVIF